MQQNRTVTNSTIHNIHLSGRPGVLQAGSFSSSVFKRPRTTVYIPVGLLCPGRRPSYLQYLATVSTLTAAVRSPESGSHSRLIYSGTPPSVQSVSDKCLKRICSLDTSAFSALGVLDDYCAK